MFQQWSYDESGLGRVIQVTPGITVESLTPEEVAKIYPQVDQDAVLRTYGPGLHTFCEKLGEWVPMPFLLKGDLLIAKEASMKGPRPVGVEPFTASRFRSCFPGYEAIAGETQALTHRLSTTGTPWLGPPARSRIVDGQPIRTLPAPVEAGPVRGGPYIAPGGEAPLPADSVRDRGWTTTVSRSLGLPDSVNIAGLQVSSVTLGLVALGALWLMGGRKGLL